MDIFNPPEFTIEVSQYAVLSGDITSKKAQLLLLKQGFDIEVLPSDDEEFHYSQSHPTIFELIVEYNNQSTYHSWTIPLTINDVETNDFIIKPNDDYVQLLHFIDKFILHEKLDTQLLDKKSVKKSKI